MAVDKVRPGYKRTEVGIIPEDWEVVSLRDLLLEQPSYGLNAPAVSFDSSLPTYLRITDITEDGRFAHTTKQSVASPLATSFLADQGDVFFARTGASVGKSYLYTRSDGPLVFAGFLIRVKADPNRLLAFYLSRFTQTQVYKAWVNTESTRSGQPGINAEQYAKLPLPVPATLREQVEIVSGLQDAGSLVLQIEALLSKQRDLKQAAMQELLKPKKHWHEVPLGLLCELSKHKVMPTSIDRPVQCIELEHIEPETGRLLDAALVEEAFSQKAVFHVGDILFGKLRPYLRKYWKATLDGICSTEFWVLRSTGLLSQEFLFYLLQTDQVIESANQSTGTKMPRADWHVVRNTGVSYPPDAEEQAAIAAILTDMDAEIAALEARLSKYRDLQKGMMQQLLTGAIRLV